MDEFFPEADKAVQLAYWFHDFIYDTHALDNEEQSAEVAQKFIRFIRGQRLEEVASLILATKHHQADSENARILLDIDLSILSEPAIIFDQFEQDIRLEYDWVPLDAYKAGRSKILEGFLAREIIYHTEAMKPREALARDNLRRSLNSLAGV